MSDHSGGRMVVEAGLAGVRAGFLIGEATHGLFVRPTFCDPLGEPLFGDAGPQPGDIYRAIVRQRAAALGGAFVDLGPGTHRRGDARGFLPDAKTPPEPEGTRLVVAVRRAAIGDKAPVMHRDWQRYGFIGAAHDRAGASDRVAGFADGFADGFAGREAGLLNPVDGLCDLLRLPGFSLHDPIIVHRPDTAERLNRCLPDGAPRCIIDPAAVMEAAIGERINDALEPVVPLAGGGHLIITETPAGVMIDIDSGAGGAAGAARPAMATGRKASVSAAINRAAAARLAGVIPARRLGGRIIIDFLTPQDGEARKSLGRAVDTLARAIGGRVGSVRKDGLADMTVPRSGPSLLAALSVPASGGLRPGRDLSPGAALCLAGLDLEARLEKNAQARFQWRLGHSLGEHLAGDRPGETGSGETGSGEAGPGEMGPAYLSALRERYGARVVMSVDKTLEASAHAIDEIP